MFLIQVLLLLMTVLFNLIYFFFVYLLVKLYILFNINCRLGGFC